ncbi:LysR family transcriptional regulator [Tuberibacillus sp. Marseille-P3662]|uniref:LysR family transcriptional regulator n=1 Tax=Tuberibacillus sp. Marseille-P3662 TaxID=1965358 RepID=UPI000A1CB94A|nr:LysR family transcriptional regulator [Tuberibacillus sp. Marseille-P3662]
MQRADYEIICVLADEKNMRRAAERLFVSQPALSQRLHSIETHWETEIFIRSKRGLILTPEGEKIADFAKKMLEEEDQLRDNIVSTQTEVYGTLKLAVASIIGQYWLPRLLKKYVETYPHVKISLMTGWSSDILRHMYENDTHIGIIRGKPKWRGKTFHLFSDALNLVDTNMRSIKELDDITKPYIQFKSDSSYYQEIQEWWHHYYQKPPERTIIVDQIETCKQMAINGIGYAILPSISLTDQDQHIFQIPLEDRKQKPLTRDTWLLTHHETMELKQVKAFMELVRSEGIDL